MLNQLSDDRPANNPELRMLWERAHRDLEIPADEVNIRAKSRAELEGPVHLSSVKLLSA